MTIHIEIAKAWVSDRWQLRVGDIEGSTEDSGITKKELLENIQVEIDKEDDGHDSLCEGSMCFCKNRLKKVIKSRKDLA